MELHGNEVLLLILLAQKRLVDLGERAFEHIGNPEEQHQVPGSAGIERGEHSNSGREQSCEQRAACILPAGEPFVRRVLVHPPGGGVDTGEKADAGGEKRGHGMVSSSGVEGTVR